MPSDKRESIEGESSTKISISKFGIKNHMFQEPSRKQRVTVDPTEFLDLAASRPRQDSSTKALFSPHKDYFGNQPQFTQNVDSPFRPGLLQKRSLPQSYRGARHHPRLTFEGESQKDSKVEEISTRLLKRKKYINGRLKSPLPQPKN